MTLGNIRQLAMFISNNIQVVQIRIQVSHAEAVFGTVESEASVVGACDVFLKLSNITYFGVFSETVQYNFGEGNMGYIVWSRGTNPVL